MLAEQWWDYTAIDEKVLNEAAKLSPNDVLQLSRPGFKVVFYDTLESFYLAEALEYIDAWKQATPSKPAGICGPIGPTEQLPLVAQLVNSLEISLKNAHFWGMDEWCINGKDVPETHPLSFARADRELCFDRIKPELKMPEENIHFPKVEQLQEYKSSFEEYQCVTIQGGQGDVKHWAFNGPFKREGSYCDGPPISEKFRTIFTRIVNLHLVTLMQKVWPCRGGYIVGIPTQSITVGTVEMWKLEKVSIWYAETFDSPFGMRSTAFRISKNKMDTAILMFLLADHHNVVFNYDRPEPANVDAEMQE